MLILMKLHSSQWLLAYAEANFFSPLHFVVLTWSAKYNIPVDGWVPWWLDQLDIMQKMGKVTRWMFGSIKLK